MTRYEVIFGNPAKETTATITVRADNEKEAIEKARKIGGTSPIGNFKTSRVRVRIAKEEDDPTQVRLTDGRLANGPLRETE
jgi:hypothetical protein